MRAVVFCILLDRYGLVGSWKWRAQVGQYLFSKEAPGDCEILECFKAVEGYPSFSSLLPRTCLFFAIFFLRAVANPNRKQVGHAGTTLCVVVGGCAKQRKCAMVCGNLHSSNSVFRRGQPGGKRQRGKEPLRKPHLTFCLLRPAPLVHSGVLIDGGGRHSDRKGCEALGCSTLTGAHPSTLSHWLASHLHRNARHHHATGRSTAKTCCCPDCLLCLAPASTVGRRPGQRPPSREATTQIREMASSNATCTGSTLRTLQLVSANNCCWPLA